MASPHSLHFPNSASSSSHSKRNSITQLPLPSGMQSSPSSPNFSAPPTITGRASPSVIPPSITINTAPSRQRLPIPHPSSPTSSSFHVHTSSTHAGGIQPPASFFRPSRPHYTPPDSPASSHANSTTAPALNQDARDLFPLTTLKRDSDSTENFSDDNGFGEHGGHEHEFPSTSLKGVKHSREPLLPIGEGGPKVAIVSTPSMGNDRSGPACATSPNRPSVPHFKSGTNRLRNSIDMVFNLGRGLSIDSRRSHDGSRPTLTPTRSSRKRIPSASSEDGFDSVGFSDGKRKLHDEERGYPSSHFSSFGRHANSRSVSSTPEPPSFIGGPNRTNPSLPPIPAGYSPSSSSRNKAEHLFAVPKTKDSKLQYNYQLHPSRNRFFFKGRILTGGDSPWAFVASFSVFCAITGLWFGTTCQWWWHDGNQLGKGGNVGGKVLVCIVGYLALLVLVSMLKTATSDPGILPRNLDPDPPYPTTSPSDGGIRAPLPRDLKVRADVVRVKYCPTCKTYRPPRSSHCKMCDNCVDGCDHHCQWVNNCIGRRNYTTFFVLLLSATITLLLVLATTIVHIYFLTRNDDISFRHATGTSQGAGSAAAFCLSVVVIWPVSALLSYHVRLLLLNITTIEQIRNQAHKTLVPGPAPPNPFSHGTWRRNLLAVLCRPPGYSWLDPSGVAMEDKREVNPGLRGRVVGGR